MRTFQLSDAKSHKFWTIDVYGTDVTVAYGKVGTAGTTQTKTYDTPEKAQAEADKLVREKTKKGYAETTPTAPTSDAEAFEAALRANPDELATACAYADYLTEQGDPRGEFMQVQIALEDESRTKPDRDVLRKREAELLKAHQAEWVGEWATHPAVNEPAEDWSPPPQWVPYTFTRGLLTGLEFGDLTRSLARQVSTAPGLGHVRDLTIHGYAYEEGEGDEEVADDEDDEDEGGSEYPAQAVALRWPFLSRVRTFRFGGEDPAEEYDDYCPHRCHMPGDHVHDFVKQMPDIEVLHVMAHVRDAIKLVALPMPRLRVFLLYHGWSYPLDRLAKNHTLGNLRELYCHPHAIEDDEPYIRLAGLRAVSRSPHLTSLTHLQLRSCDAGDEGAEEIVRSGLLKRLKFLDLRHGVMTDEGARLLAGCPDLKNLDRLDLSRNRLTEAGIAALTSTGVNCHLVRQGKADDELWETFSQGDFE